MKKAFRIGLAGILLVMLPAGVMGAELRDWRASSGDVMVARLVQERDGKVELQTRDGRTVTLDRELLSQADQNYLEEYGGAPEMADGSVTNLAKGVKFDSKTIKKRDDKLNFDELDLDF